MRIVEFQPSELDDEVALSQAIDTVRADSNDRPVVIVAAMGNSGHRLLKAGEKSVQQDLVLATTLAEGVRTLHMQISRQLTSERIGEESQDFLSQLFEELSTLLKGLYLIGHLDSQGRRVLESYAERACALLFAHGLNEKKVRAGSVCARRFYLIESESIPQKSRDKARAEFHQEIASLRESGAIPVTTSSLRHLIAQ